MFCGNCGANNPEGSSVCGSCGAALTPEETTPAADKKFQLPTDKNKLIGLGVIAAGVIVAIALLAFIVTRFAGGSGAEATVAKFIKASMDPKGGKTLVELTVPKSVLQDVLDDRDFDDKGDLITDYNDDLEDYCEECEEYFGKYKVKVESRNVDEWKNSKIKEFNEEMENDDINMEIKDGATVKVKVTVEGKDDKETYKDVKVDVVKVGNKWYVTDEVWTDAYRTAMRGNSGYDY